MKDNKLKEFLDSSHIFGTNAYYIEDMYDHYLEDPNYVDNEGKVFLIILVSQQNQKFHNLVL